jgi:hypothetical protein
MSTISYFSSDDEAKKLAHPKPISPTVLPLRASNETLSAVLLGSLLNRIVAKSGWGSEAGIPAKIIWANSSPDVEASTVRRAVPAGERIRSSWSSGIVFATLVMAYHIDLSGELWTVLFCVILLNSSWPRCFCILILLSSKACQWYKCKWGNEHKVVYLTQTSAINLDGVPAKWRKSSTTVCHV